jgi:hypothetical protein
MIIHAPIESPYRVSSKNEDFRNVWIDIWLKTPKNHVKIRILKGRRLIARHNKLTLRQKGLFIC